MEKIERTDPAATPDLARRGRHGESLHTGDLSDAEPPRPGPYPEAYAPGPRATWPQTIVAIAVMLGICYYAKLVLITLLVSILLAFMLWPVVAGLARLRIPQAVGALVAVTLVLAALYGGSYFFYNRAVDFAQDLPKYSGNIRKTIMRFRQQAQRLQQTTETILPKTTEDKKVVKVEQQTTWSEFLTKRMESVGEFFLVISFIPFLVYFMLTGQAHVHKATVMLFTLGNRDTAFVTLGRISGMIRGFIVGNVVVGFFMSAVSMVIFAVLGLPYFYFLGFLSGFLSLMPYMGVVLALLPPLAAGLGVLGGTEMLIIILSVFGLHLFAINVLYPMLLGRRMHLNPLAVTIALLLWGWLWGAMGLILAVPITAAMKIIFDQVERLRPYGAWLGE